MTSMDTYTLGPQLFRISARMELYESLFADVAYPLWDRVLRGRPTLARHRFLEGTQWCPPLELATFQAQELRRLLEHVYANVPHYREAFERAKIVPGDIRSTADLHLLPIIDRSLAIRSIERRTAVAGPRVDITKATSGTTGLSLTIGYNRDSDYWRQAVRLRGYGWAGYRPGRRALHFWGFDNPRATRIRKLKIAADRLVRREVYVDCIRRGDTELEAFARNIEQHRPRLIVAYSQAIVDFATYATRVGRRNWPDIPVICGAERLFSQDRKTVEGVFGAGVFETYGCREVMLVAAECEAHQGMHVSMENLVVEIVVRDAGGERPARPGETGEVVLTDLHNYAVPLLRYASGDLATAGPDHVCTCGRGLARIAAVVGRTTDTLFDRQGNRVGGLIFHVLLSTLKEVVSQFQVIQHEDRSVTFKLVPGPRYDSDGQRAIREIASRYIPGLPFTLEEVHEIPPGPNGKRHIVQVAPQSRPA